MKSFCITYVTYNGVPPKQYRCCAKSEKEAKELCKKDLDITDSKIIKVVEED